MSKKIPTSPTNRVAIGWDPGNERVNLCAIIDGVLVELEGSSMVARKSMHQYEMIQQGMQTADEPESTGNMIVKYNGLVFALGQSATEGSTNGSTYIGSSVRYTTVDMRVLMMGYVAQLIKQQNLPKEGLEIMMVTNVPIQSWGQELNDAIKTNLAGNHNFYYNDENYQFSVDLLEVKMEGAGGARLYATATSGRIYVLDGGSYTHNVACLVNGWPVDQATKSFSLGVNHIILRINSAIERAYGRKLTTEEMRNLMWTYAEILKTQGKNLHGKTARPIKVIASTDRKLFTLNQQITVRKKGTTVEMSPIDLFSFVQQAIIDTTEELYNQLATIWASDTTGNVAGDAKVILYFGGGAYYFRYELEKYLSTIQVPSDPQRMNARGEAARAQALLLKKYPEPNKITQIGA